MENRILNLAFYKFCELAPIHALKKEIEGLCDAHEIRGSIILGYEGINGMLAGEEENAEAFLASFRELRPGLSDVRFKRSWSKEIPFQRMIIKVKPEIVTMRVDDVDPIARTGTHLPPEQLRDWIREGEEMVLIDVRNHFEYKLGTFKGALDPDTTAFHEFPEVVRSHDKEWKEKKVVMFCTGGIRCEKATSWMLDEGFENIYQLDGGVLGYFEKIPDAEKDWEGELFVFDERVTLDTKLEETSTTLEDIEIT